MTDIQSWPALPFDAWKDTCATLHLWTQIVGKIRLAKAPMTNHWWQVPLYVTCRGLTTSPIPHESEVSFQFDFDFIDHRLRVAVSDGRSETLPLEPCAVVRPESGAGDEQEAVFLPPQYRQVCLDSAAVVEQLRIDNRAHRSVDPIRAEPFEEGERAGAEHFKLRERRLVEECDLVAGGARLRLDRRRPVLARPAARPQ